MDARPLRLSLALCAWLLATSFVVAAEHRTANFVAYAPTPELAKEVAFTAEQWRDRLAVEWLGKKLPKWSRPCPIQVKVGQIGAGGATTFNFDGGEVYGWRMNVQGTRERILDSVIPHEVSHTIFASHFRRPLPRWADEGAATLAEAEVEQRRQDLHLKQVWGSGKIPLNSLLSMTEYPTDMRDVMTLYAEGYSLADYLVQKGNRPRYLRFLDDAEKNGWETALRKHYGIEGVAALEGQWGKWVVAGSPDLPADGTLLADNSGRKPADGGMLLAENTGRKPAEADATIRAQNLDAEEESPVPPTPPELFRTALADSEGFLPPQSGGSRTVAAAPVRSADGKEPRPEPLDAFREGEYRRSGAATETADERPVDGRRSLPRTSRVEPTDPAGDADFFDTTSGPLGGRSRTLGAAGSLSAAR